MADNTPVWATLCTAGLAVAGVVFTELVRRHSQKKSDANAIELARLTASLEKERDIETARREAAQVLAKFRDPLMHAAYDMQSRIYNIVKQQFLERFYTGGSSREQEYAVENTVFLFGQFLGWTEIIRQEIQFLSLDNDDKTTKLRGLQDGIYTKLQNDTFGKGFRLFAGEQRAIGELMIDRSGGSPRCLGFAAFLTARNPALDRWMDPLRDDVKQMAADPAPFHDRLIAFQHSLIDLLEFLDPNKVLFPVSSRGKITL
jgi:hypothetical protein